MSASPRNRSRGKDDDNGSKSSSVLRVIAVTSLSFGLVLNGVMSWRSTASIQMKMKEHHEIGTQAQMVQTQEAGSGIALPARTLAFGGDDGSGGGADNGNATTHQDLRSEPIDWFDKEKWDSNPKLEDSCPYVEHVCFQQQKWFYDKSVRHFATEHHGHPIIAAPRQPHLNATFNMMTGGRFNAYFESFRIEPAMPMPAGGGDVDEAMQKCQYSPNANHMILHGQYSYMLGEFFVRVYVPTMLLINLIADTMGPTTDATGATLPTDQRRELFLAYFARHTQIYQSLGLGLPAKSLGLLESHRLFLESFSSNPILPMHNLFDNTRCQCVQRMFLCGYNRKVDGAGYEILRETGSSVSTQLLSPRDVLHPNMAVAEKFIRSQYIGNTPNIAHSIEEQRRRYLERSAFHLGPTESTKEYRIIGLTQRKGRRRWLEDNFKRNLSNCNSALKSLKVHCVEVMLESESMWSPAKHLISHAALDGLIGIHGAQLTEALLMPPGSLVVELLPWVLEGLRQGRWTNTASGPTPVGVMFSGTSLNHVGYPLDRSSASTVPCDKTGEAILECYQPSQYRWDTRPYSVDPSVTVDVIRKFTLRGEAVSCQELQDRSGDDFVLYNVHCAETKDGETSLHHMYRPSGWVDDKVKTGRRHNQDKPDGEVKE